MSDEVFEDWLARLEPATDAFVDFGLPERHTAEPFTRDSLEQLGPFILWLWPDVDAVFDDQRPGLDGMVRYVGETLRRRLGGTWAYSTDVDADLRGVPYLDLGVDNAPLSPFGLILSTVEYRDPAYLTRIYDIWTEEAPDQTADTHPSETGRGESAASDDLAHFLGALGDHINAWARGPAAPPDRWDFSLASLSLLGHLLVDHPRPEGDLTNDPLTGGAIRYIGEVLRRSFGGEWGRTPGERTSGGQFHGEFFVTRTITEDDDVTMYPSVLVVAAYESRDASVIKTIAAQYGEDG